MAGKGLSRRQFLQQAMAGCLMASLEGLLPAYAWPFSMSDAPIGLAGRADSFELVVRKKNLRIGNRTAIALTVNDTSPGPLLRFREGQTVTIRVMNELDEDTSIHWHGIILPAEMDGVPGISFPGIPAGRSFTYRYTLRQSGTYWYHSHTRLQEQLGHYGPLIIDPADPEPFRYDREYIVMLADWSFEDPYAMLSKLKKQSDYYNAQQLTLGDLFRDASAAGWRKTLKNRLEWGRMRMDPTDIADITGQSYTYLINGLAPEANWTGIFRPGERVRLRFINGSSMTHFNLRIPDLPMTIVQADGQNVKPVVVDEFQIAAAETYDVIVEPGDRAYTLFAESMDRSGFARGALATREGMSAPIPELRPRPILSMADMGMAHNGKSTAETKEQDSGDAHAAHTTSAHGAASGHWMHGPDHHGPTNAMVAMTPVSKLDEPGTGLENTAHRVLAYIDLQNLEPRSDPRQPDREIEMHLTGNMERYMWSIDGKKYSEAAPIRCRLGERLRITLVNDTMMNHPFHLHGMWMELVNGGGSFHTRKHTINVKPAEKLSFDMTAAAPGDWAFHCHLLFHMHLGMFRVISVIPPENDS